MITKRASVAISCLLCVLAGGCSGSRNVASQFSSVTVMLTGSPEKGGGKAVVLKNQADIEEAAAFFPGLTKNRKSNWAGWWGPHMRFTFACADNITIEVSSDYTMWRKPGAGDFWVKGDLEVYVKKLFAEANPQSASQE